METIIPVGADVHKDTNSVCMFDWNDGVFFAEAAIEPGVENMIKYIEKARKEYGLGKDCRFLIGYEAGPTGYGLCRGLQKKGYDCVIMAPTTIKKSSSDKRIHKSAQQPQEGTQAGETDAAFIPPSHRQELS